MRIRAGAYIMSRQIRTRTFFNELQKNLENSDNERLKRLSSDDLIELFDQLVDLLGHFLSRGFIVIFKNHFSFFTNPVKRQCYTDGKKGYRWSFARRVRFRPAPAFRRISEIEITEEEYLQNKKKK